MHNNIEGLDRDDWGMKPKYITNGEILLGRAFFFFVGVVITGVIMHIYFISPLLNSCI